MRVGLLCSNRWNSAITEYALRSAQALKAQGCAVELLCKPGSPGERRAREYGVAGPSVRFKAQDALTLWKWERKFGPDALIAFGGPETFLARFLKSPLIRFRGQDSDLSEPLKPFSLRMSLSHCEAVLTPSEAVAEKFRRALPGKNVVSIPLGLDTQVFHYRPRPESPRPRLLIVGRLDPIKGHREFFPAFKSILDGIEGPKPLLEVLGEAANLKADDLRASAQAAGLREGEDWILTETRVSDLPERMAAATLGLIPSLGSEVICRVAEEFLLTGTALYVSGVGSLKECLLRPEFGTSEETEIRSWIERARRESEEERKVRSQTAAETFGLSAMAGSLEALIRTVSA